MKIKETLLRDPSQPLANDGTARVAADGDARDQDTVALRGELEMFVCEGQYADGLERILDSFLSHLHQPAQSAAWVSGLYGSGKSHLLKMLAHLWVNTKFQDGSTARSLAPALPQQLQAHLRELDTLGARGGGLAAAAGTMVGGRLDAPRLSILAILLRGLGLPANLAPARLSLWLHREGILDAVRALVEAGGKRWELELNSPAVGAIPPAIMAAKPGWASSEAAARDLIRQQFPNPTSDIPSDDFIRLAEEALLWAGNGKLPCAVLVLDEVQQFIESSPERCSVVADAAEALSKHLQSRLLLVGAGQQALQAVPNLKRLMDRFTIKVALGDADVEAVTRRVLLRKRPQSLPAVRQALDQNPGEIARQLQGTALAARPEDAAVAADDYPLLPVRRRFWERLYHALDDAGTQAQLRSQLQILRDGLAGVADQPLGTLLPADFLFHNQWATLAQVGKLPTAMADRINALAKDDTPSGRLDRRIAATVWLINQLPTGAGEDLGVRANAGTVADLLVDDLAADNNPLRQQVVAALARLANGPEPVLQEVGGEFRLQTREGSEWEREFRAQETRLNNDLVARAQLRDNLLYAALEAVVPRRFQQGAAKEPRHLRLERGDTPPAPSPDEIVIWARDEWSATSNQLLAAARQAGNHDARIFVFLARRSPSEFEQEMIRAAAAEHTLDTFAGRTAPGADDARRAMQSRLDQAARRRDALLKQIVESAAVYQAGGAELLHASLAEKLQAAVPTALDRLFPRFAEADASAWDAVYRRARGGDDRPFEPLGYVGKIEAHPVCAALTISVGSGKRGSELRDEFTAAPYGWPKDAIDASLIALVGANHLRAEFNAAPIAAPDLDHNNISKTALRAEAAPLLVQDKLAFRALCAEAGIPEAAGPAGLLARLRDLAAQAGGDPPLPPPPGRSELDAAAALAGNAQWIAFSRDQAAWRQRITDWNAAAALAAQRLPAWALARRLARHAPQDADACAQLEEIERQRLLLAPNDPVAPARAALASTLRADLTAAFSAQQSAHAAATSALAASDAWRQLDPVAQGRILREVALSPPATPDTSTDETLAATLEAQSLAARRAEADAAPARAQRALELAARALEPKARVVPLEAATLRNEADLHAWLDRQEAALRAALKSGPVVIAGAPPVPAAQSQAGGRP